MMWVTVLLAAYAVLALAYWLWMLHGVVRLRRGMPRLEDQHPPEPARWPRVSVIAPACNEADAVEAAARTLLAQDYPDLEIVLVDDRSTDATGAIIDRLAAEDPRVRAVHVTELPEGWLGKVHALKRGLEASSGALALLTDADVHFAPGTLRQVVAWVEHEHLDHVAALPKLWRTTPAVGAVVASFIRQFLVATRPWAVRDPRSRAYLGIGAFNLVRRSALDRTEGLEWLRMETADDMGVGLLMKRSGARSAAVTAFQHVGLYWYRSVGEAARGAEKGFSAGAGCSLVKVGLRAMVGLAMETAPVLALAPLAFDGVRWIGGIGVAVAAAYVATSVLLARWAGGRALMGLLGPVTAIVNAGAFLRCGWLGWRRGGVLWRGTLYPTAALRAGQRVKFP